MDDDIRRRPTRTRACASRGARSGSAWERGNASDDGSERRDRATRTRSSGRRAETAAHSESPSDERRMRARCCDGEKRSGLAGKTRMKR